MRKHHLTEIHKKSAVLKIIFRSEKLIKTHNFWTKIFRMCRLYQIRASIWCGGRTKYRKTPQTTAISKIVQKVSFGPC